MARLEVALRSPLAFWRGPLPDFAPALDLLTTPPEPVGITFEAREFVWHPPTEREWGDEGLQRYGPMVAVVIADDSDASAAARVVHRFLSAIAFAYDRPVDDEWFGSGSGESDAYHWAGSRKPTAFVAVERQEAPTALEVDPELSLWVALAYYREALNASSPFYRFLAFWNVLAATFDVEDERTAEARRRDDFVRREAPRHAWRNRSAPAPTRDVAAYFRDDARNAISHVWRTRGREIDPDDPDERVRLRDDASWLHFIARAAIEDRWPNGVRVVRAPT